MIVFITILVKILSQNEYNQITNQIDNSQLKCPGCNHTGMTVHGYYDRKVKADADKITMRIKRVICQNCGTTHALLPNTLVPYSQISMKDTIQIIVAKNKEDRMKIMEETPSIDESDILRVIRNFKLRWKQRLLSYQLHIDDNICENCIRLFKRQFMQIPCTLAGSYSCHHIIRQDLPLFPP